MIKCLKLNLFFIFFLLVVPFSLKAETAPRLEDRLKAAVIDAQKKLELSQPWQPWQKKIFEEEVVPRFPRFIRGYRSTGADLSIDVNVEGLKKYISFYAPKIFQKKDPKISVLLFPDLACRHCMDELLSVRKSVQSLLERRGFSVQWLKREEFHEPMIQDELSAQKSEAVLFLKWKTKAQDPDDLAHADEVHYELKSLILLKTEPKPLQESAFYEMAPDDHFSEIFEKILGNSFSLLNEKWKPQANPGVIVSGVNEVLLEVSGFQDFSAYTKLKLKLETVMSEWSPAAVLEERKMSKGKVTFAIKWGGDTSELKRSISKLLEAEGQWIKSEIK